MKKHIVIGGGPSGLMAAEILSAAGHQVAVYDRMPSVGRKLLIAGRGGLNLTHSEPLERFCARYGERSAWLAPMIEAFPPQALIAWAQGLGQETFVGSSGRVFPMTMKASPLLRAWLKRLAAQGVEFKTRHRWVGWSDDGRLKFESQDGENVLVEGASTVLALGGASWPRLGSNGDWVRILEGQGIGVEPLRSANCGFSVGWSDHFQSRFAGTPLQGAAYRFNETVVRGEAMVTRYGLEGGAIYALSSVLRNAVDAHGKAELVIDLRPEMSIGKLVEKLSRPRAGESLSNLLRKSISLAPVGVNLLREVFGDRIASEASALAQQIKAVPLTFTGSQGLDRAISSAGGVRVNEVDDTLMLRKLPGVHVTGEMMDWEAPTGGYLLQACFATGVVAARGIVSRHGGLEEIG